VVGVNGLAPLYYRRGIGWDMFKFMEFNDCEAKWKDEPINSPASINSLITKTSLFIVAPASGRRKLGRGLREKAICLITNTQEWRRR